MTEQVPAWPRDTTYVHVTPEHVKAGKRASLTGSAAALAIAGAIGSDVATVSVDVDLTTAHEKRPPFRWWAAETPEEVAEWLADLDRGDTGEEAAEAATLGLLDFWLTWRDGNPEAFGWRLDGSARHISAGSFRAMAKREKSGD
jgi:hypothetical protein